MPIIIALSLTSARYWGGYSKGCDSRERFWLPLPASEGQHHGATQKRGIDSHDSSRAGVSKVEGSVSKSSEIYAFDGTIAKRVDVFGGQTTSAMSQSHRDLPSVGEL